jgi:uncharacterized protein (TIGR00251 family)
MAARSRADSFGDTHTAPRAADTADTAIVDSPGGCVIAVRVIPRAKRSAFDGQRDGAAPDQKVWLVRLAAPPVDGAANEALLALFAEVFGLPRRSIQIVSGERAREKRVRVEGLSAADARARLRQEQH